MLLKSVRDLFSAHHLSDVILIVKGRRIPAHRHVLATHSRVFERMWGSLMREVRPSPAVQLRETFGIRNIVELEESTHCRAV